MAKTLCCILKDCNILYQTLVYHLVGTIVAVIPESIQYVSCKQRQLLWSKYNQIIQQSQVFWKCLHKMTCIPTSPIFNQVLMKNILHNLLKQHHKKDNSVTELQLTEEEKMALYGLAGYAIFHIKSISNSACKENILPHLLTDTSPEPLSKWLKSVDNGNLHHVNSDVYIFFEELEMKARLYLHALRIQTPLVQHLLEDEALAIAWNDTMIACHLDSIPKSECSAVFREIVEVFAKCRQFAFCRGKIEEYKRFHEVNLEKSRSFRSQQQ